MELTAGKYWGLRRLATDSGQFAMLATDQRPPIFDLIKAKRGTPKAAFADVAAVKRALTRVLAPHASALLTEPLYGYWAGFDAIPPHRGLIVTLEEHAFRETPTGRLSNEIADWSVAKIKRLGADAVKVLAWYRPDASPEIRMHQQSFVQRIGEACRDHDICYVLELLVYALPQESPQTRGYVEQTGKRPELVIKSVRDFADPGFGVDLFKLESPIEAARLPDPESGPAERVAEARAHFAALAQAAARPWVMLSAGAGMAEFERVLGYAYAAGASGYLAGRSIWWPAAQRFPDIAEMERCLAAEAVPYMESLNALTRATAQPWTRHPAFAGGLTLADAGPDFRRRYATLPAG